MGDLAATGGNSNGADIRKLNPCLTAILAPVAALAIAIGMGGPASAQAQFDARYTLSMAGIAIGKLTWRTQLGPSDYTTSASGGISGFLSLLVKGEGTVTAKGRIKDGQPQPVSFVSAVEREDERSMSRSPSIARGSATSRSRSLRSKPTGFRSRRRTRPA